jgi:ATP/maltotriose-dependent transcriptional regulator MalT
MPRTAGEYKADRRRQAVAAGFCLTCCANVPIAGKRVCATCAEGATARTTRRRSNVRELRDRERLLAGSESLGDQHYRDGDYRTAGKSYERAFAMTQETAARTRLAAKVGRSAFFLGIGTETDGWFNVPLDPAVMASDMSCDLEDLLKQQMRILWSRSCRTTDMIALSERVMTFASSCGDEGLLRESQLGLATAFMMQSRLAEARQCLDEIAIEAADDDNRFFSNYRRIYGIVFGFFGEADACFESLAKALAHAEYCEDVFQRTVVYMAQALCATALGRLDTAAGAFREALTIARRENLVWMVPYLCLENARILSLQGRRHLAHAYVNEAAVYDSPPPVLVQTRAEIGIPIALECDDPALAEKCANEDALTFVFQSGEPWCIAPLAASFARYYASVGRPDHARALVRRALRMVTSCDQGYGLPLAIADFGDAKDIATARGLLEKRLLLPNAAVAMAHIPLFDALVHTRHENFGEVSTQARTAADRFAKLGWVSHSAWALRLAQERPMKKTSAAATQSGLDFAALSPREYSVAELAIGGLSNREIADKLAIKERTVEVHMTSILGRLGLRSRHQLGDPMRTRGSSL